MIHQILNDGFVGIRFYAENVQFFRNSIFETSFALFQFNEISFQSKSIFPFYLHFNAKGQVLKTKTNKQIKY